ncbi:MAG: hypothetical protein R3E10_02345 [Gemmatimonadota bacterium]
MGSDPKSGRVPGRAVGLVLTLALAVLGSGCYTFQPVQVASPGERVRARLTVEEAIRQSQERGEPVRNLEGTVTGLEGNVLDMEVVTARGQTVQQNFQFATRYSIPMSGIESLSLRQLAPVKTGALVTLLAAGVYLALDALVIDGGLFGDSRPIDVNPASPITPFRPVR